MTYKIAFTGSSGSGKTTLAKWVSEEFNIPFISGSSSHIKTKEDEETLKTVCEFQGGGHENVIKHSILYPEYGLMNQRILLTRRIELITNNSVFVTDRSPLDNVVYFINQCGFHKQATDGLIEYFVGEAIEAFKLLTHIIYIKPVQPFNVEDNGSRVPNKFYQQAIDAQFEYWLLNLFILRCREARKGILFLKIDWWDLNTRKNIIKKFLISNQMRLF